MVLFNILAAIARFFTYSVPFVAHWCDPKGVLLYESLGCKPIFNENERCASSFNCSQLLIDDLDGCSFKGKKYSYGQEIDFNDMYPDCYYGACYCEAGLRGQLRGRIVCKGSMDCQQKGDIALLAGQCRNGYALKECCPVEQICPNTQTSGYTCKVDGHVYKEGEKFYPKDSCLECLCLPGFKGIYVHPYCRRESCNTQVSYGREFQINCAPVREQRGKAQCCDLFWVCPSGNETIVTIEPVKKSANATASEKTKELQCNWGDGFMNFGKGFRTTAEDSFGKPVKVECVCDLPPLLSCRMLAHKKET